MSQEVHDREVKDAVEEALYELRMAEALRASRADYAEGRSYSMREEVMTAVAKKRVARAQA